jgi:hypothetical protein
VSGGEDDGGETMIEAWKIEHRPLLYAIVRRIGLWRWAFQDKQFYPSARWYARLQALWIILWGHETEICAYCGGGVDAVWWCPDNELWKQLTGEQEGGGVSCMRCFERRAREANIFLEWTATADSYEEWRDNLEKDGKAANCP